ncbi:MAG: hypothetical protein ACRD0L_17125 [Acidimicrobiales bacterium]
MLASIHPLGERARRNRWSRTVAAYVAGSVAGGAVVGAVLGAGAGRIGLGPAALGPVGLGVIVAAAAVVAIGLDAGIGGVAVPTVRRQVDERWLSRYRGWVYGVGFGFQLGAGVVTIVTSAAVYVALALALLTGSAAGGLTVGATFGLVRSLPVLAGARVRDPGHLRRLHRRLQAGAGMASLATTACLVALALAGVALAVAGAWPAGGPWRGGTGR